jgi:hypothetical protein
LPRIIKPVLLAWLAFRFGGGVEIVSDLFVQPPTLGHVPGAHPVDVSLKRAALRHLALEQSFTLFHVTLPAELRFQLVFGLQPRIAA